MFSRYSHLGILHPFLIHYSLSKVYIILTAFSSFRHESFEYKIYHIILFFIHFGDCTQSDANPAGLPSIVSTPVS